MSPGASSKQIQFARRLLAQEAVAGKSSGQEDSAAFRVCEKMRVALNRLMGGGGVRALFARSLALAQNDVIWLRKLEIKGDGSFAGFERLETGLKNGEIAQGEAVLLARLLELLITFIGPSMTLHLIQAVWPKANFDDLDLGK